MTSPPPRFYIASLGCPKNTVDANAMGILLRRAGFEATLEPHEADLVIVNTCGFIEPARQESLETMRALADQLRPDQRLVAAGCWAQRAPQDLQASVPALDAVLGTRTWHQIVPLARRLFEPSETPLTWVEGGPVTMPEQAGTPGYVVSGPSAFLKIADGCSRACAFCAIPAIKGPSVSRTVDAILEDARQLQELGVLEINLVAQDATDYGHDRGHTEGLADLLERLVATAPEVPWIRLLYAYPGYLTPKLMHVIAEQPHILPYIDLPLQHAHPAVLRRMRRPADVDQVRDTVQRLRDLMPDVALRTAFIVGFPGETEAEFLTLLDFVNEMRFDRMGVFLYSEEAGTAAAELEDDVPAAAKQERYEALMVAQQTISYRQNLSRVGSRMEVLLEGVGDGLTVGRSYRDAPEIDGLVLIQEELTPHRLVTVEITDALEYDVVGQVVPED